MRRPLVTVVALAIAGTAACGSSGKGGTAAPAASVTGGGPSPVVASGPPSSGAPGSGDASSSAGSASPSPSGALGSGDASSASTSSPPSTPGTTPTGGAATRNGGAARAAAAVFADMKAALAAAPSLRLSARGTSGGKPLAVDVRLSRPVGGGSITTQGFTVQMVRVGSELYVKGNAAFYSSELGGRSGLARQLQGRWLRITTDPGESTGYDRIKELATFTDPAALARMLTPVKVTKGAPGTVRGVPTVTLIDAGTSALSVAAVGPPYPLRLAGTPDGTLEFLDYGVPVALSAPPAADTVDVASLPREPGAGGASPTPSAAG